MSRQAYDTPRRKGVKSERMFRNFKLPWVGIRTTSEKAISRRSCAHAYTKDLRQPVGWQRMTNLHSLQCGLELDQTEYKAS